MLEIIKKNKRYNFRILNIIIIKFLSDIIYNLLIISKIINYLIIVRNLTFNWKKSISKHFAIFK